MELDGTTKYLKWKTVPPNASASYCCCPLLTKLGQSNIKWHKCNFHYYVTKGREFIHWSTDSLCSQNQSTNTGLKIYIYSYIDILWMHSTKRLWCDLESPSNMCKESYSNFWYFEWLDEIRCYRQTYIKKTTL